jgi:endonuclease/exonuclease/phosphatase family metal-dependent hydrolase
MIKRYTPGAVVLALLPLLLSLAGCATNNDATPKRTRDADTLRVMTYNIHIAKGLDEKFDLQRIANIIKAADVDVVAVQEVDVNARRSGNVDEAAELARLTGMHGLFGKAIDHDGGDYGQAVLSRRPILSMDVHKLPAVPGEEQRIALVARIAQPRPLPNLLFVGTHLHHKGDGDELRLAQAAELNRILKEHMTAHDPAVLLLGDFNASPDSVVMTRMWQSWDDPTADAGMTVPAEHPNRKIDYLLLPKGHNWEVVSAKVLDEPVASDHRPVVVELRWKGK